MSALARKIGTSEAVNGRLAADLSAVLDRAVETGDLDAVSLEALRQVFAAVVKLYAAKVEASGQEVLAPVERDALTATQAVVAACGLIRAADLNLFDVAMWFGRYRPEDADRRMQGGE